MRQAYEEKVRTFTWTEEHSGAYWYTEKPSSRLRKRKKGCERGGKREIEEQRREVKE